jgi:hypothetical protein
MPAVTYIFAFFAFFFFFAMMVTFGWLWIPSAQSATLARKKRATSGLPERALGLRLLRLFLLLRHDRHLWSWL